MSETIEIQADMLIACAGVIGVKTAKDLINILEYINDNPDKYFTKPEYRSK